MTWNMHSMIAVVMIIAGGEGAERCVAQSGARGVAVSTQRAAQPYEFAYDHVSGELGSQDDLFMRECRCPLLQLRANPVLQMLVMLIKPSCLVHPSMLTLQFLDSRHQVRAMHVSCLQTGLF